MALSMRQRRLYTDRVNVWDTRHPVSDLPGDAGTPQDDVYVLLYRDVPCKFEFTLNVDDPTDVGGFKRKSALTTDTLHLPIVDDAGRTLRLPNGCLFVNVTSGNPNKGSLSMGQGAANLLPGAGSRSGLNTQIVQIMTEEHAPDELVRGVHP